MARWYLRYLHVQRMVPRGSFLTVVVLSAETAWGGHLGVRRRANDAVCVLRSPHHTVVRRSGGNQLQQLQAYKLQSVAQRTCVSTLLAALLFACSSSLWHSTTLASGMHSRRGLHLRQFCHRRRKFLYDPMCVCFAVHAEWAEKGAGGACEKKPQIFSGHSCGASKCLR